jgi:hypothetical protein
VTKNLIAIMTCWRNQEAADAIRATWAKNSPVEVRFILGQSKLRRRQPLPDELLFNVPDDYNGLVHKVKALITWAHEHGYDHILKVDDDCNFRPERIRFNADHAGHWAPPTPLISGSGPNCPTGFIHGGSGYILSRRSMGVLAASPITSISEDWWVTDTLNRNGIRSQDRSSHIFQRRIYKDPFPVLPTKYNDIAVCAEFAPPEFGKVHRNFIANPIDAMSAEEYKRYINKH